MTLVTVSTNYLQRSLGREPSCRVTVDMGAVPSLPPSSYRTLRLPVGEFTAEGVQTSFRDSAWPWQQWPQALSLWR